MLLQPIEEGRSDKGKDNAATVIAQQTNRTARGQQTLGKSISSSVKDNESPTIPRERGEIALFLPLAPPKGPPLSKLPPLSLSLSLSPSLPAMAGVRQQQEDRWRPAIFQFRSHSGQIPSIILPQISSLSLSFLLRSAAFKGGKTMGERAYTSLSLSLFSLYVCVLRVLQNTHPKGV